MIRANEEKGLRSFKRSTKEPSKFKNEVKMGKKAYPKIL